MNYRLIRYNTKLDVLVERFLSTYGAEIRGNEITTENVKPLKLFELPLHCVVVVADPSDIKTVSRPSNAAAEHLYWLRIFSTGSKTTYER
jgi:hypothetical protein